MSSSLKVYIKPQKSVVSGISVNGRPPVVLRQIIDVDASSPDDGETLVYDAQQQKYVVKEITVSSNNITNVIGGTF